MAEGMPVHQVWHRIVALLAEHAPTTAREIRPPAPAAELEQLQRMVDLPADLVAWWSITDGVDDQRDYGGNRDGLLVPNSFMPLPVTRAAQEYTRQAEYPDPGCCSPAGTHRKPAGDSGFPCCTALVPICRAASGDLLCVDLREGDDHGWIMEWAADEGFYPSGWADLAHLLTEIAERLENYVHDRGLPYGEQHPVIEDGTLTWLT